MRRTTAHLADWMADGEACRCKRPHDALECGQMLLCTIIRYTCFDRSLCQVQREDIVQRH